ncbi:hypothetical protein ACWEFL_35010 [Streptomyces sp. NPDC004838]
MSEQSGTTDGTGGTRGTNEAPANGGGVGPQPEPIRFFGTTWVGHDGGYGLRRAGVAAGSLAVAAVGCLALKLGYEGLVIAEVGGFLNAMVIVMFSVCSAIAFRKTWEGFSRPAGAGAPDALSGLRAIGFVGVLLAWFFRSLIEAPGEKLHREEYEKARAQYEKRRNARTGNPSARKGKTGKQKRK